MNKAYSFARRPLHINEIKLVQISALKSACVIMNKAYSFAKDWYMSKNETYQLLSKFFFKTAFVFMNKA